MSVRVLVLGAAGPAGYNFCRAAWQFGHRVVACDVDPVALGGAVGTDRVLIDRDRPASVVNELVDRFGVELIHAQPDPEVRWLAANQHLLNAPVFLPNRAALFICADKFRTAQVAGPDAPATLPISEDTELERAISDLGGDCWVRLRHGAGSAGALPVRDAETIRVWLRHHEQFGNRWDDWAIARRLPGRDLSWTGVYREGELFAWGQKERLRHYGAGRSPARVASTASLQVTTDREDVHDVATRVVRKIQGVANGVFMVDMREDEEGVPKVTEINCGRFGTTSLHWHAAGNNLVDRYIMAAKDERRPGPRGTPAGHAWHREMDIGARPVQL